jgi:ABC-2 type transport system ATP-binding protein
MPAIETTQLSKRFRDVTAVDAIDLAVPERSVYGFLGPNGAGKTTTIRLLLGLLRPSGGSARIFGHDVTRERLAALRSVGAIVETPSLYDHLSGRANLEIACTILGLPSQEIDRTLELVGLAEAQRRRVGGYSLGMRQRLALARALLGSPKLLLLDEPTNGLDPDGIQEMRGFIRSLPERTGATVLLSSHLLSEVEQTATHVGMMSRGRLVVQDSLAGLLGAGDELIDVEVDAPDRAAAVLAAAGSAAEAPAGAGLRLRVGQGENARERAAAVNALLVSAGLKVFRLAPRSRRLEDVYMARVGGSGPGGGDVPAAA